MRGRLRLEFRFRGWLEFIKWEKEKAEERIPGNTNM